MVRLNDHRFAPVAEYAYDALGRRIEFRNHYDGSGIYGSGPTEVATRYVYDGQNVIEEYNTNGDRQRYYVHGTGYIDERAVMHDDVGTDEDYYYLLKDLYTVVGLAQANGHELERYIYDAYGKATVVSVLAADVNFDGSVDSLDQGVIRSPSQWLQSGCDAGTVYDINMDGTIDSLDQGVIRNPANWYHSNTELSASALGNPYFFTARRRDAYLDAPTGTNGVKQIQYSRARYYDLDNARWLQRDPIGYKDGMNLYEYAKSAPTRYQDAFGKKVCGPATGSLRCWMEYCAQKYSHHERSKKPDQDNRITWKLLSCIACQESSFQICPAHTNPRDHGMMGLYEGGALRLCQGEGFFQKSPDSTADEKKRCCGWDKQPKCGKDKNGKPKEVDPCAEECEKSLYNIKNQICCAARYLQSLRDSFKRTVPQGEMICKYHKGDGPEGRRLCEEGKWKDNSYTKSVLECLGKMDEVKEGDKDVVWPPKAVQ